MLWAPLNIAGDTGNKENGDFFYIRNFKFDTYVFIDGKNEKHARADEKWLNLISTEDDTVGDDEKLWKLIPLGNKDNHEYSLENKKYAGYFLTYDDVYKEHGIAVGHFDIEPDLFPLYTV